MTATAEQTAEARAHDRLRFSVTVDVKSDDNFYTGLTENISEGGLFIVCRAPWPVGSEMDIALKVKDSEAVELRAVVRWVREDDINNGGIPPGMGVQFVGLDDATRNTIQAFIDSHVKPTELYEV